jgi:hypothetical protein
MTSRRKLRHLINPCDIDRFEPLAPLGDWLADLSSGCPCCDTVRVILAFVFGAALASFVTSLL